MYEWRNGGVCLETLADVQHIHHILPRNGFISRLYLDFETTSGNPKLKSTNPWHNCAPIGYAFTWDAHPYAYWCDSRLVGEQAIADLCRTLFDSITPPLCEHGVGGEWVNHNVKYDAHVAYNAWKLETPPRIRCTLDQAKIIDSDRTFLPGNRAGYGLDVLSREWCGEEIGQYEKAFVPYLGVGNTRKQDYALIPSNVLGEYAAQDVITNRRVDEYIREHMESQCRHVSRTSSKLMRILVDVERRGVRVDPTEILIRDFLYLKEMLEIQKELAQLTGYDFNPNDAKHLYDLLINVHGLPVVKYTEVTEKGGGGNPSFDKEAMTEYLNHPFAPQREVKLLQRFKKRDTARNIFLRPWTEKSLDAGDGSRAIHSTYNPTVVTGRMACSKPNMQQLDEDAKELVHPRAGYSFFSTDASGIEFRVIVSYINNQRCIEAYNADPDTDFHKWVADLLSITRKPAKTCNFLMGYGGGKGVLVRQLARNVDIVGEMKAVVMSMIHAGQLPPECERDQLKLLCEMRAAQVYDQYHGALPTLKPTSWKAADALKRRGKVFDIYGRHRHLEQDKAHKAFNSICQASAADLVKERTVACLEWVARGDEANPNGYPIHLVAIVHDELLFEIETVWLQAELSKPLGGVLGDLIDLLEHPACRGPEAVCLEWEGTPLRVPIRWYWGTSDKNWNLASKEAKRFPYRRRAWEKLENLERTA